MPRALVEWSPDDMHKACEFAAQMRCVEISDVRLSATQLYNVLRAASGDSETWSLRHLGLRNVVVVGDLDLQDLTVSGHADFSDATFAGALDCRRARFRAETSFARATFRDSARFDEASFEGYTSFHESTFMATAAFHGARFEHNVNLGRAVFEADLHLRRASFTQARQLGPLWVGGTLVLVRTVFEEPVRIEVGAGRVDCAEARFRAGVDLLARFAAISADGADFAAPSLVSERKPRDDDREVRSAAHLDPMPRVESLRGAKVAQLTLACVDLRPCSFANAHGLDRMRIERVELAEPPGRRRTRRRTISEEHRWRAAHEDAAWASPAVLVDAAGVPEPAQIAGVYRALRKGREDDKDEPGAADFYYGEMEMRRRDRAAPSAERLTLLAYWLVSGYGMRASRALLALLLTIALLAVPLDLGGFRADRSYAGAVLYAVESSVSLLRAPQARLTASGQVVTITLRILGPLLFGLAALALRSRVKR